MNFKKMFKAKTHEHTNGLEVLSFSSRYPPHQPLGQPAAISPHSSIDFFYIQILLPSEGDRTVQDLLLCKVLRLCEFLLVYFSDLSCEVIDFSFICTFLFHRHRMTSLANQIYSLSSGHCLVPDLAVLTKM